MSQLRVAAWSCLRSGSPFPLREVDAAAAEFGLDSRDRALLRRLVGTEVRRRGTLRAIAKHLLDFRAKPDLLAHLHLGLAQIFFLDKIPDHAAVSETNRAVHITLGQSKVRFSNAILRSALRARREGHSGDARRDLIGRHWHLDEPVFRDPAEHPLLWAEDALSLPAQLYKRWLKRLGEERAAALASFCLAEPPLSLRVVRGERAEHLADLRARGVEAVEGAHPALLVAPPGAVEEVVHGEAFESGALTVQGETALRAAELVEARAGERVLDLCAAPGGKTAVLAATGAEVVACDLTPEKLERLGATLTRLGLAERVRAVPSDGTAALDPDESFDAVLVDAPCSNTGVLGARPAARWRFGPASLASLGELQGRLLEQGAARVRPGGRLVWSTCSLEPEENGRRVRDFLESHPGWTLQAEIAAEPGPAPGPVDGGMALRLVRGS